MRLRCASCFVVLILALGWSMPADLHAQGNNDRHDNDKYDIDKHDDGHGNGNTGMAQQIAMLQAQVVALTTALNNEVAARKAADARPAANLNNEIAALKQADMTLQAELDAEATTRAFADGALQGGIDAEASARIAADAATSGLPQAQRDLLDNLVNYVTVDQGTINGLSGPHIIFTGVNLHIRNGSGSTYFTANGLGNLLVGYNEYSGFGGGGGGITDRVGSHNLVVGSDHRYTDNGGFVAGRNNKVFGPGASVSGGAFNTASGDSSSVSGGGNLTAFENFSWTAGMTVVVP
jgi:hypothetical protein